MTSQDSPQARLLALLEDLATEIRPCKFCSAMLYFVPSRTGKIAPYTGAGINHFQDCPHFAKKKPAKAKQQEPLFAKAPDGLDPS